MEKLKVREVRSDALYRKIMAAPMEKRDDIFRYDFMKLFEKKWELYHIPLKASKPGGYDIVMASGMLGYLLPKELDGACEAYVDLLSDDGFWQSCKSSIERSLQCFEDAGIDLPVRDYVFTVMLANPESPYAKTSDNYSGDGGIPGYIFGSMVPSDYTKSRLPVALAHETGHNVRYQFIRWSNDITLGQYIVAEGLAESFAAHMYGTENVGPWVTKTDGETLNDYIKPLMAEALGEQGFDNITAWMYGDELAALQGYIPAGMPYCAGYACGYYLVKHYLQKTGKSIVEATILPADEILAGAADFWTTATDATEAE